MSIRETIQKQKGIATAVSLLVFLIGSFFIARQLFSGPPAISASAYFTTDDGATLFVDSMEHLPPFDHNGKTAYRAWMYTTDEGKTKFLVYLERYTPAAKQRFETELAAYNSGKSHVPPSISPSDAEVKKPGAGNLWVGRSNFTEASKITDVQTPPGTVAEVAIP
jgi:hypothetical protein